MADIARENKMVETAAREPALRSDGARMPHFSGKWVFATSRPASNMTPKALAAIRSILQPEAGASRAARALVNSY